MLKKEERSALIAFLRYHSRGFHCACHDHGCDALKIRNKIELHKAEANRYRERPLTHREQAVVSGFLRRNKKEFDIWCGVYEVGVTAIQNALKGMANA